MEPEIIRASSQAGSLEDNVGAAALSRRFSRFLPTPVATWNLFQNVFYQVVKWNKVHALYLCFLALRAEWEKLAANLFA